MPGTEAQVYSFGGIDSSLSYTGIHLKSFRMNLATGETELLPNLPDTLGKIAAGASRIGNIIYIIGGYHVYANGNERSSFKVHRYNLALDQFISDAADLPVATDDHVQAVYKDSLIYVISGWSDVANIPDVQIFDPAINLWIVGTPTPNNDTYKSFGASGSIIGDTIYYFGGASSSFGFNNQPYLRKGYIHPENPSIIDWSISIPDQNTVGYRMACTDLDGAPIWFGGSEVTYNYDGIAYNGSGNVRPAARELRLVLSTENWIEFEQTQLPMDLRGIANVAPQLKYILGGILKDREVSDQLLQVDMKPQSLKENEARGVQVFPNPGNGAFRLRGLKSSPHLIEMHDVLGRVQTLDWSIRNNEIWIKSTCPPGLYFLKLSGDFEEISIRVLIN